MHAQTHSRKNKGNINMNFPEQGGEFLKKSTAALTVAKLKQKAQKANI